MQHASKTNNLSVKQKKVSINQHKKKTTENNETCRQKKKARINKHKARIIMMLVKTPTDNKNRGKQITRPDMITTRYHPKP
jgi:hypothetical protein